MTENNIQKPQIKVIKDRVFRNASAGCVVAEDEIVQKQLNSLQNLEDKGKQNLNVNAPSYQPKSKPTPLTTTSKTYINSNTPLSNMKGNYYYRYNQPVVDNSNQMQMGQQMNTMNWNNQMYNSYITPMNTVNPIKNNYGSQMMMNVTNIQTPIQPMNVIGNTSLKQSSTSYFPGQTLANPSPSPNFKVAAPSTSINKSSLNLGAASFTPKGRFTTGTSHKGSIDVTTGTKEGEKSLNTSNTVTPLKSLEENQKAFNFDNVIKKDEQEKKLEPVKEEIAFESKTSDNKINTEKSLSEKEKTQPTNKETPIVKEEKPVEKTSNNKLKNLFDNKIETKITVKQQPSQTNKNKFIDLKNKTNKKDDIDAIAKKVQEEQKKKEEKEREEKRLVEEQKRKQEEERKKIEEEKRREKEEREEKEKEERERREREREEKLKKEEQAKTKIEKFYFIVKEGTPKTKNEMSLEYMIKFSSLKICEDNKLLTDDCKNHLDGFKVKSYKDKFGKEIKIKEKVQEKIVKAEDWRQNLVQSKPIATWGRLHLEKEIEESNRMRQLLKEQNEKDPLKSQILDLFNRLTVDSYKIVYEDFVKLLKNKPELYDKFLELLFIKASTSKFFAFLYANLCKDLDSVFKENNVEKDKNPFKELIIKKARELVTKDYKPDESISNLNDRYNNMKKIVTGNINFITELIISRMLNKSVFTASMNALFSKLKKIDDEVTQIKDSNIIEEKNRLKAIYLESILQLIDVFGTSQNDPDSNLKSEAVKEINCILDDHIKKLENYIDENRKTTPNSIYYNTLNLVEKRNNGWKLSEVDRIKKAKGEKALEEEALRKQNINSNADNEEIIKEVKKDLKLFKDFTKNGGNAKKYPYSITMDLFKNRGCKLSNLLEALNEISVDFVVSKDAAHLAAHYFYEHVDYFIHNEGKEGKEALKEVLIANLSLLNEYMLDTIIIYEFWGKIIWTFEVYDLPAISSIDSCEIEDEEQVEAIFKALYIAINCLDGEYYDDLFYKFSNTKLYKKNSNIYKQVEEELASESKK